MGSVDNVTLVTMESFPPYSPMSLPYLISGTVDQSNIWMVPDEFFDRMNAKVLKNKRVVGVDPRDQRVLYDNGENEPFDRLLIATGSDPIVPPILDRAGGFGFHVMDDYLNLIQQIEDGKRITILGAGLVALELAAALKVRGNEAAVIAPRERILRRYFDIEGSHLITNLFRDHGIAINMNWGTVTTAQKFKDGLQVHFSNDKKIETQMLLVCIGVKPRVSFLTGSGIIVNEGVAVDDQMRTNIPGIFAAGDVAEARDFFSSHKGLNPILPNAVLQGKIAGSNMVDKKADHEGSLPMNTFNFFGHLAVSIGKVMPSEGDEMFVEKDSSSGYYRKIICRAGRLLGATFLDSDVNAGVFQYLIKKKVNINMYKEMLVRTPREVGLSLMLEAERKEAVSLEE